jgi:hypothetical protein
VSEYIFLHIAEKNVMFLFLINLVNKT